MNFSIDDFLHREAGVFQISVMVGHWIIILGRVFVQVAAKEAIRVEAHFDIFPKLLHLDKQVCPSQMHLHTVFYYKSCQVVMFLYDTAFFAVKLAIVLTLSMITIVLSLQVVFASFAIFQLIHLLNSYRILTNHCLLHYWKYIINHLLLCRKNPFFGRLSFSFLLGGDWFFLLLNKSDILLLLIIIIILCWI